MTSARAPGGQGKARTKGADVTVPVAGPELAPVALVTPTRTGRAVASLDDVLRTAEVRLKLAWLHRAELDPVLPQKPPFHAHSWTALRLLQSKDDGATEQGEKARAALDRLLTEMVRIRKIVAATTGREDEAREKVGMRKTLRANYALVDEAEDILRGAEQVRARFPALTDTLLTGARTALSKAREATKRSKQREVDTSVQRAERADERQLALDVLLSSLDHLRAAAMGELAARKPRLAAVLEAPIESRSRSEQEATEPGGGKTGPDGGK